MKQILSEEFRRMKKIAGLITENELNEAVNPLKDLITLLTQVKKIADENISKADNFDLEDFSQVIESYIDSLEEIGEFETYPEELDEVIDESKTELTENKYRASDFPEVTGFEEDNNRIIITFSDNTKDLIEPRNFANKEVGYSKFLELLNTMDTDPKAKQAVSDFMEIKRFNVISTSDINKLLADNGVDEEYYAGMGGKEIEGGTEAWIDIIEDIIGKPYDSNNTSKKDDMKIQTFMNHLSRLGIEVV